MSYTSNDNFEIQKVDLYNTETITFERYKIY